jgi:hypothetical protein
VFKLALLQKKQSPGAKIPSSNFLKREKPSNARQSEVDPEYIIDMSRILPRTSDTA